MGHDSADSQLIELTREFSLFQGVRFDPSRVCLTGTYSDELSLFRAKKIWAQTLEDNFLLERDYDYEFSYYGGYYGDTDRASFVLNCTFVTACGRYAFWRLTNNQAPEAQYLIETAHIPNADSQQQQLLMAPDLTSVEEGPCVEGKADYDGENGRPLSKFTNSLSEKARRFFDSFRK